MATVGDPPGQWALATRQPRFMSPMDGCQRHQDPMGEGKGQGGSLSWTALASTPYQKETRPQGLAQGWPAASLTPIQPNPKPHQCHGQGRGIEGAGGGRAVSMHWPCIQPDGAAGQGLGGIQEEEGAGARWCSSPSPTHPLPPKQPGNEKEDPPPGLPSCLSQAPTA